MNIFDEVKERTNMRSIAECYGFTPDRGNYICCPFHSEKTPSMRLYEHDFHCYGCGEHGNGISFVMKLYNLPAIEAAQKINADFALGLDIGRSRAPQKKTITASQLLSYYQQWEKYAFRVLNGYYKLLKLWFEEFAPKSPDDEPYPLWVRACHELPKVKHFTMILIQGSDEERRSFFINHREEVEGIAAEYHKYIGE